MSESNNLNYTDCLSTLLMVMPAVLTTVPDKAKARQDIVLSKTDVDVEHTRLVPPR